MTLITKRILNKEDIFDRNFKLIKVDLDNNFPEYILKNTPYLDMLKQRYQSYDTGNGKAFEKGELSIADLYKIGVNQGDIAHTSGKQERYESILANSF